MTEYDYSPDAHERYMATQSRIARWAESTSSYPPSDPFMRRTPSVDGRRRPGVNDTFRGHHSHHRHEHRGRPNHLSHVPPPHPDRSSVPNIPIHSPQPVRPGTSDLGGLQGATVTPVFQGSTPSLVSRPNSRAQGQAPPFTPQPSHTAEAPPLPEHYASSNPIMPPMGLVHYPSSQPPLSQATSHYSSPHHMSPYPSQPITPMSSSSYHSRYHSRSRSPDYSDDSYSAGSRDRYEHWRSPYYYGSGHSNMTVPTVIQPSRSRPTILPINGGAGGYVVIPPAGQTIDVVVRILLILSVQTIIRTTF
jgi:hypothetical protein